MNSKTLPHVISLKYFYSFFN